MYTVFLTGGIGSGKSTVAGLMRARGARVVDLDEVAHEVLREPQVKLELARRFGEDVLVWPEGFDACWIASGAGVLDCTPCPPDDGRPLEVPCGDGADWKALFAPGRACTIVDADDPVDGMCLGDGRLCHGRPRLARRARLRHPGGHRGPQRHHPSAHPRAPRRDPDRGLLHGRAREGHRRRGAARRGGARGARARGRGRDRGLPDRAAPRARGCARDGRRRFRRPRRAPGDRRRAGRPRDDRVRQRRRRVAARARGRRLVGGA